MWRRARQLGARAKGREHLAELGQLAGGLTHEIKNPLSTINVNLQLLAEDIAREDNENHRRWLRRLSHVQEEANRLSAILDDFLHYAGKLELDLAAVDIRRIISELVDFFTPQAEAAHVLLRITMHDQPVVCNVDANLIKQAVLNLMINATEAMTEAGELLIHVGAPSASAMIEVTDTGPGMDSEAQARIFDVYYSTKKHGTGLGLPTARRIIREHGGSLRVESELGKGTRFVISLPVAQE
jgi:signal transduction histidine kinase